MSAQACSVPGIIATVLLSSHKVLGAIKSQSFQQPLDVQTLRDATYLTYQPWAARHPDHVFERGWHWLVGRQERVDRNRRSTVSVTAALLVLADEFLEPKHGAITVKLSKFDAWQQSVLSRICGLPARAAATVHAAGRAYVADASPFAPENGWQVRPAATRRSAMPLLSPHDDVVEDYVEREGLHETHLHLNGSTSAEVCWLRALLNPTSETRDFDKKWKATSNPDAVKVRELAHAVNPLLTPTELFRQLRVARQLREWLVAAATDSVRPGDELPTDYQAMASGSAKPAPEPANYRWALSTTANVADELGWMTAMLRRLDAQPSVMLDRMLHCYLVLQNQYYRLLVQSEEQFGFDQFQKLTCTELREPAEKDYVQRFQAIHGGQRHHSRVGYLEGRFAPKPTLFGNRALLRAILGGYWRYLQNDGAESEETAQMTQPLGTLLDQLRNHFETGASSGGRRHRLTLVAHFIKQPWSLVPAYKAGPYRFYTLRNDLESRTNVLLQTLHRWPGLRNWLCGIDAAGNEVHAPPEVFASCFRVCQQAGLTRRSYHVGEDFPHLLSGLRHMLDALELLNLQDGDRIGHGTAMGISPKLWVERMPGRLIVTKGEWMLDLLAAWRILRRLPDTTVETNRVECDLQDLACQIFGRDVSGMALERAMKFRHLNLRYLMAAQEPSWRWEDASFNELWRAQARQVHEAGVTNRDDLELLRTWFNDKELWKRSEALFEVDTAYFDTKTFVLIQQALMAEVKQRKVVIEMAPSSNVRISQYHSFQEHHSLRWMRVPGHFEPGDPEIMVSLGSDDPGIFAGDLNGEFYQLYAALRNEDLGDGAALGLVASVNERGRQYRFHAPLTAYEQASSPGI